MNDQDLKKIDEMLQRHLGVLSEDFQHKLDLVVEGHQMLVEKADDFQHKLDLVVEGHQMLAERIDRAEVRLDQRMDGLERKICEVHAGLSKDINAVAADLREHRSDTEVHKKIYKVKEE